MENILVDNSLADSNIMIFKVELPEGEKVKDKKDLFKSTGMQVKTVKNENKAIIATTKTQFQLLKGRIDNYAQSGSGKTYFVYIADFKPYIGSEKNSSALQRTTCAEKVPLTLDVQLMLLPNLDADIYDNVIKKY